MATNVPASSPDMPITIKVIISGKDENRKFKLPLRDLGANSLPDKVCVSCSLVFMAISTHLFHHLSLCVISLCFVRTSAKASIFHSSALCSILLQVRQPSLSVIPIARPRSLPWIPVSHLSTSNCIVLPKPSKSSRFESPSPTNRQPSRSRCQSQALLFQIVFPHAAMFIPISRILSRLRTNC